jgi:predicted metal-dependent phosphoesterase TrpH
MVDLHSHTDRSDGTLPPNELVDFARRQGLSSLAITDHDTVEGYDAAAPRAREVGLDLVCGVWS